ncbi:MAG: peptide chain release factor 1, partial [Verrucomicrobiae bacterium]|nr:peptide chain release factor 1 [Verrucomicrobiae bacterium]
MNLLDHRDRFEKRFGELEKEFADPNLFAHPKRFQEIGREHARLKKVIQQFSDYAKALQERDDNRKLLEESRDDASLTDLVQADLLALDQRIQRLELDLQGAVLPPDPNDARNVILEIRAGTGGDEAALFAGDLYRMYTRYAEVRGWKVEPLSSNPAERGGFKEIIALIEGEDVYRHMRYESGVHRVQRVPATEANGRIHTSAASVAIMPEAEEVDIELRPEDLEITVCRASGPGGQGVNTTDSAVQIHHKPTGVIVRCADERSQLKNKTKAFRVLRARLLETKQREEEEKQAKQRKSQIGSGDRSEKIRTY